MEFKKPSIAALLSVVAVFAAAGSQQASADSVLFTNEQIAQSFSDVTPLNLIDWKVGDEMEYSVAMLFGKVGTMKKAVTKDEVDSIWMRQNISLLGNNEVVDVQLRKADGKILKMIRNGQEQQVPDEQLEVISQDYTEITVPAGKFQVIHVVAKTASVSKIEVWMNPKDTVMDGAVKQMVASQLGDVTMELLSFKHGT